MMCSYNFLIYTNMLSKCSLLLTDDCLDFITFRSRSRPPQSINNNNSDFYSAFLSTQRRFTEDKRQTEQNKKKADKTNKQDIW